MNNYSIFNDPHMYHPEFINTSELPTPTEPIFVFKPNEEIQHTSRYANFTPYEEIRETLDAADIAIIEEVARSKYLTSLQVYQFITLRGCSVKRSNLRKKMLKLMKCRLIQEKELQIQDCVHSLKYFELDCKGFLIARDQGVIFNKGNRYTSYGRKLELGITETPLDIKRILVANQIILGLLMSNARMERFGIMETFRPELEVGPILDDCIFRTAANVKIDETSVLAYEVVRDCPESYEKLADKIQRYYKLLQNRDYLARNHHNDAAFPQLIICGESLAHNRKIVDFLKSRDLWGTQDTILFTEDLLNLRDSLQSIYEISDDGQLIWYRLPEKTSTSGVPCA